MPVSINTQAYIFLYSVLSGIAIGLIYDIFRIKRKTIKTGALFIYIEDILYWIIVAIIVFALIFYSNDGEIRGYIFIGALIGVVLYMIFLSKIIVRISMEFINLVEKIIKFILFIAAYPFRIIIKILCIPMKFLSKPIKKFIKSIKACLKLKVAKLSMTKKSLKNIIKKI